MSYSSRAVRAPTKRRMLQRAPAPTEETDVAAPPFVGHLLHERLEGSQARAAGDQEEILGQARVERQPVAQRCADLQSVAALRAVHQGRADRATVDHPYVQVNSVVATR